MWKYYYRLVNTNCSYTVEPLNSLVSYTQRFHCSLIKTVERLIENPPRKGQHLYKGHFQYPQKCICNTFSISKKRRTSLQGTEWLVPKCPVLRGPTVVVLLLLHYLTHTHTCITVKVVIFK